MTDSGSPSDEEILKAKGYKLIRCVGEGAYAKVYLADYTSRAAQGTQLACKLIDTSKAPRDFVTKFLPREISVLVRLDHPHIVHVHSIFQFRSKFFIFMRYTEQGDLLEHVVARGAAGENQARVWLRQLALALQYLHELALAHRDIKCENVLLTANNNVKLSDFGFSRSCVDESGAPVHSETYCGSMSYAAPEVLRGKPYLPRPTDVWSLGVVLFVILNKAMPFDDTRMRKLYEQQMARKYRYRPRIAIQLSLECKSLIKHLLEPDPSLRYSATQVLKSDWIAMDSRLTAMNNVEIAALKRAKETQENFVHRLSESKQGDLYQSNKTAVHKQSEMFKSLASLTAKKRQT